MELKSVQTPIKYKLKASLMIQLHNIANNYTFDQLN